MHSHDLSGVKKKNAMMDQTSSTVDKSLTKKKKKLTNLGVWSQMA